MRSQILRLADRARDGRLTKEQLETYVAPALGCVAIQELADRILPLMEDYGSPLSKLSAEAVVVFERPPRALMQFLLKRFAGATSWRGAEHLFDICVWPWRDWLEPSDIERVLTATQENGEIWNAGGMHERLARFFEWLREKRRIEPALWSNFWNELVQEVGRYGGYKDLQNALVNAEIIAPDPHYQDLSEEQEQADAEQG